MNQAEIGFMIFASFFAGACLTLLTVYCCTKNPNNQVKISPEPFYPHTLIPIYGQV
jgi:hypothetical protein